MTPDFAQNLRQALEESLGFALKPLVRLDGATTLNFKAERESDGFAFAVKCVPLRKRAAYESTLRQLDALAGTKAVSRLFPGRIRKFGDYDIVCLSWCEGERLFPDQLTDEQADALVDDYLAFSAVLQQSEPSVPTADFKALRQQALDRCRGLWARGVRKLIDTDLAEDRITLRAERARLVHGDFHHGNFLFRDGRISGIFDFENITWGYPTEDFIRYFVCASEHLRWYNQHRKRRILRMFRRIVLRAPYGSAEWEAALDRLLMEKVSRKAADYGLGFFMSLNLLFRAHYYRVMKRIAALALNNGGRA